MASDTPAPDERAAAFLAGPFGGMDTAKVAGLIVLGAVAGLAALRSGFGGVQVRIGD